MTADRGRQPDLRRLGRGLAIAIAVKDGKVYLNDTAQVTATDVMASNGVIHVIDQVILPPAELT